ncbi:MAG TPA: hypothetical protein VF043_21200 [Ktedonobacteraceae bacterium]
MSSLIIVLKPALQECAAVVTEVNRRFAWCFTPQTLIHRFYPAFLVF